MRAPATKIALKLMGVGAALVLSAATASTASAANINDPALVERVKKTAAEAPPDKTVRFSDGLYDAVKGDVYVDGNPDAVWRLESERLVPAPDARLQPEVGIMEACGYIYYFHCELTVVRPGCTPTTFWLNYNPDRDDFSDPYGERLNPPEKVSVRDEPYRRYGSRGVRAYHDGRYGFYSVNCVRPYL